MSIKTNFIILCDQAFLTAGTNNLNLIGIFTQINAQQFPIKYPRFCLVANFEVDIKGLHSLEADITGPTGDRVGQAKLPVTVNSSPFQVITTFESMVFPVPGGYEIRLSFDGHPLGSHTISVVPVTPGKTALA